VSSDQRQIWGVITLPLITSCSLPEWLFCFTEFESDVCVVVLILRENALVFRKVNQLSGLFDLAQITPEFLGITAQVFGSVSYSLIR